MSISVAMAVYNGERFLHSQIQSILEQCTPTDEIVISMDPSQDHSLDIIHSFHDSRIRIVEGPGKGVIANFENAIQHCSNPYIFLSDQDDIWCPNKREKVLEAFTYGVDVVLHDAKIVDTNERVLASSFFEVRHSKPGFWSNLFKNSYIGCCMAFRKDFVKEILPFPTNIPMHDQWIGLVSEQKHSSYFLKEPLLLYRRHEENVTSDTHASLHQMIQWRIQMIKAIRGNR